MGIADGGTAVTAAGDSSMIHRRFVGIAGGVSPVLASALDSVGPPEFPDRGGVTSGHFLARVVVGQQLSTRAARSIWSRVERAAEDAGVPIPELFTDDRHDTLRACGLSRNKVRTLGHIRAAHESGDLVGERLRALDHQALSELLLPLWGVGQWTCDMAALFYCGCPDVWPEQDVTVQKTFAQLIGRRRKPARAAERFAPHRSWLALYMWRLADATPVQD